MKKLLEDRDDLRRKVFVHDQGAAEGSANRPRRHAVIGVCVSLVVKASKDLLLRVSIALPS